MSGLTITIGEVAPHIDRAARIDELRETAEQIERIKYSSADETDVTLTIARAVAQQIAQMVRDKVDQYETQSRD